MPKLLPPAFLTFIAALGACASGTTAPTDAARAPALAASTYRERDVAVPFVRGIQVPCSRAGLEIVVFEGTQHVAIQQTVASTGRTLLRFQTNGQGVTGTGLVSGDTYRLGGVTSESYQLPDGTTFPMSYSYQNAFTVTSPGATGNIVAHETLRVDFDAAGSGTVSVVNFKAECK